HIRATVVIASSLQHKIILRRTSAKMFTKVIYLWFCFVVVVSSALVGDQLENFVRRNIPTGHTIDTYVETCESCGALYGNEFTFKCLTDKSYRIFKDCFIAVNTKK
ncbi:hypothetical protein CHS0354_040892, partial [Potamilus streckersoni]